MGAKIHVLHTITIDELAFNNPSLHSEYVILVNHLIDLIRGLADKNSKLMPSSSLSEQYDTNTNEAYLELVLQDHSNHYRSQIYIHKNHRQFVIGHCGSGTIATLANQVMDAINTQINRLHWV